MHHQKKQGQRGLRLRRKNKDMPPITERERAVLAILNECPTGATEYNLVKFYAVASSTLDRLIDRGLIRSEERSARLPWNWRLVAVRITEAGRAALAPLPLRQ
jgi:hypothetical protein